jgi:hypothetical protein
LAWTAATDDVTDREDLQYKVVYSISDNIDTVEDARTNGTASGGWTEGLTQAAVTGLIPNTTYYFNVIVRDREGNESIYTAKEQSTLIGPRAVFGGLNGTELFLGGNYIEIGISNWGDFGTEGTKPDNFRGTRGSDLPGDMAGTDQIGMSADHDGFNNGRDLPVDYYLPGTMEERFAVGYKIQEDVSVNSNSAIMGAKNMSTVITNQSDITEGILKATITSVWTDTMEIT